MTLERSAQHQWCQIVSDVSNLLAIPSDASFPPERLVHSWSDLERQHLSDVFSGKKRRGVANSGLKALLVGLEVDRDDTTLLVLCRVLEVALEVYGEDGQKKREKAIVKADSVASLCRVLRRRLLWRLDGDSSILDARVDDILFRLLFHIGSRDFHFNMKIRMSGLIPVLCRLFVKYEPNQVPLSFYILFVRASRSPRNGQLLGRQEGFIDMLFSRTASLKDSSEASSIVILEKHLQVFFFAAKNRKTRVQIIRDGACRLFVDILAKHLPLTSRSRPVASRIFAGLFGVSAASPAGLFGAKEENCEHGDVVLATLAILRMLANNRKAREEMLQCGAMEICSKELKSVDKQDEESRTGPRPRIIESLCSFCLRCMPTVAFPLENTPFPFDFPLPQTTQQTNNDKSVRSRDVSFNASFEDARSSDDDVAYDEEEVFGEPNASNCEPSDDDEAKEKAVTPTPLPKYWRQTTTQLTRYSDFFVEFDDGAAAFVDQKREEDVDSLWREVCSQTRHVMPVRTLLPYSMFCAGMGGKQMLAKSGNCMRKMILEELERPSKPSPTIVFDLDALGTSDSEEPARVGRLANSRGLVFESRFESGNLRRAVQVTPTHYELVLMPDVNQIRDHYQWFFFQVSNMRKDVAYTFEIVNCMKSTSMYSEGMQPVMFSTQDAALGWRRVGNNVCYYRNLYTNGTSLVDEKSGEEKKKRYFYSIRFDVSFAHTADVCYIAYHFPYTYSFLNTTLRMLRISKLSAVYIREDVVGHSLAGNPMKMLTVTSSCSSAELANRPIVVISARVHPGESNASWMMQGVLQSLLTDSSPDMYRVREKFLFKIIPMLNPDGVINGSHRCSLAGVDLNRVWDRPNETIHPEIYHAKGIIQYITEVLYKRLFAFVDLHGHSRKSDSFVFGNNSAESWRREDKEEFKCEEGEHLLLPRALEQKSAGKFNLDECRFAITRNKESSARVNVWRQFGVTAAYTLECTYCGFTLLPNKGYQIDIEDMKELGRDLLCALLEV